MFIPGILDGLWAFNDYHADNIQREREREKVRRDEMVSIHKRGDESMWAHIPRQGGELTRNFS